MLIEGEEGGEEQGGMTTLLGTPAEDAGDSQPTEQEGEAPKSEEPANDDTKEDGEKPAEGEKSEEGEKDDEKPEGAPEEYEAFTAPEGVELDAETTDAFKALAKEGNLTQEQAQKYIDLATGLVSKQGEALAQQQIAAFEKQVADWGEETKSDAEIGGTNLQATIANATKARDQFGNEGFKTLLADYGLGNHPEVIRFLSKVGAAVSEDGFVAGGNSPARVSFYDHPSSKKSA
jgi:hypothetical protein